MSKSKSNDNLENPFGDFKVLKGEFVPPKDDDIESGTEGLIEDKDAEAVKYAEGDKVLAELEKKKLEIASKKTVKAEPKVENEDESSEEAEIEDNVEDNSSEETEELSPIKVFTKDLYEKGVLDFGDEDEDFEDSEEGIEKLVNKTVQNRIDKWASQLPEDFIKLLEFTNNGGDPKDFINVYYNNKSWTEFKLDDDNEDAQKLVIAEALKLQEYDQDEISDMIEEWSDNGTLSKRAKSFLPKLQKHDLTQKTSIVESQKQKAEAERKAQQEYWEDFKKDLFSKQEVKGFKLTPKLKEKIWDHLTVIDKKTGKTGYQMAVEKDREATLLFALQSAEGFDVSKLEKQVNTKVSNKLGNILKNYKKDTKERISAGSSPDVSGDNPFAAFRTGLKA